MDKTKPKPFVFVLMPFDKKFDDVYQLGIKEACSNAGAYCERVDEQLFVENILERVYNQIGKADIIVAEMTGRNPNVFYETGYAHALNKRVILLTQNVEDIPFDLKLFPHVVYDGSIVTLKSELERRISWCIANPGDSLSRVEVNLVFYLNGVRLEGKTPVAVPTQSIGAGYRAALEIGMHNPTGALVDPRYFSIALLLPDGLRVTGGSSLVRSSTRLPGGGHIYAIKQHNIFFPGGWDSLTVPLEAEGWETLDKPLDVVLRIFTMLGPLDYHVGLTLSS